MLSAVTKPPAAPSVVPDVIAWGRHFDDLTHRLGRRFRRREPRQRLPEYLRALLAPLERKNGWQIAEHAGDTGPEQMQRFVNSAIWDESGVRDDLGQYVGEHLSDLSGVLVVDETGFLKKGDKSAGVQRQYSGTAGRVENCQIGVFLAYASAKGCAFIDRDLYLPKSWTDNRERCREAGIPDDVGFATKPELARQMLERSQAAGITAAWVTADEVYGGNPALRNWLQSQGQAYVMAVAQTEAVQVAGLRDPKPIPARDLVGWLYGASWHRLSAGSGSKGLRLYDWTCVPLVHADGEGWQHWLLARRQIKAPHEVAYYRVFGPSGTPLAELVRVAGMRWSIEVAFESAKQEAGLDEYEVRRWTGWYRHVTLSMLAHAFLVVIRRHAWDEARAKKGAVTRRLFRLQRRRSGDCSAVSCGAGS
jgi:SRSO17 transposase